jgi:4-amino-4-deoxy-L-arabinose transferase-like glycosyltransferase
MKRLMFALFLTALALLLFANRSETVFGADSSGYMNLARMLGDGTTVRPIPLSCSGCEPSWFVPLGFIPAGPGLMALYYPVGVPLHLVGAAAIGGWEHAPFFVSPLAALLLVLLTYRLGWLLHSELAGLIAGVLTGLCAVLLFQAAQPMSDVLAAMWCTAAMTAALEGRRRPAFAVVSGFCFGVAVLVRPTDAVLLVPLVAAFGGWRALFRFALGGLPTALILGWYNSVTFGSALSNGYAALGSTHDFAVAFFPARAVHYLRWTVQQFSVFAVLAAGIGLLQVRLRERLMLASWFVSFFVLFSFYLWYDTWWYTRFLLPAYPALALAAGIGFAHLVTRPRLRIAVTMILIAAFAWQLRQTSVHAVLFTDEGQRWFRVPMQWIARELPPKSLVLSMEYSGALVYYSSHDAIRWDLAPADRALAFVRSTGRPAYALLMQHEEDPFVAKYGHAFRRVRGFEGGTLYALSEAQAKR